jgi:hypothetical protein
MPQLFADKPELSLETDWAGAVFAEPEPGLKAEAAGFMLLACPPVSWG